MRPIFRFMKRDSFGKFSGGLKRKLFEMWETTKKVARYSFLTFIGVGMILTFINVKAEMNGVTVVNQVEAETKVATTTEAVPPILRKIAQAESWDSQYCTAKLVKGGMCEAGALGQVLVNKTRDVGRYAINLYYNGKFCADKGFNIFVEKDNESCAIALFNERGSEPWSASRSSWNH